MKLNLQFTNILNIVFFIASVSISELALSDHCRNLVSWQDKVVCACNRDYQNRPLVGKYKLEIEVKFSAEGQVLPTCKFYYQSGWQFSNPPISLNNPVLDENQCTAGNPIKISSGNKVQRELLFELNTQDLLREFWIEYQSITADHWSHPFNFKLLYGQRTTSQGENRFPQKWLDGVRRPISFYTINLGDNHSRYSVIFKRPDQSILVFETNNGSWEEIYGKNAQLETTLGSNGSLAGWRLTYNNQIELYDSNGRIKSVKQTGNSNINFSYDTKNTVVSNSNGQHITLFYDTVDRLNKVEAFNGDIYLLGYDNSGPLIRMITSITFPDKTPSTLEDNPTLTFLYEDERNIDDNRKLPLLSGIIDENGYQYTSWSYDDSYRGTSSSHNDTAQTIRLEFVDNTTTSVVNTLDKKTTYHYGYINNQKKLLYVEGHESENCAAANQYRTYYPNGLTQTQTDWKGNVNYYERDNVGRELIKQSGYHWQNNAPHYGLWDNTQPVTSFLAVPTNQEIQTTQTCWHPVHNQPERIIEAERVTDFIYHPNGALQSKTIGAKTSSNNTCPTSN